MKITPQNLLQVTLLCFVLFLSFSCNKDTDLLAEYVVEKDIVNNLPNEVTIDLANAVFTTEEDQPVAFNVLYNTSSQRKGRRRYKRSSKPKYGEITIEKDSIVVYTPSNDYNGKDDIEITLEVTNEDETTSEVVIDVDVTVEPVADVVQDTITAVPDEPTIIEPLKNDTFNEDSEVIITEVSEPSNGTAVINEDNTITYTPNTTISEEASVEEGISEEVISPEEDNFTYTTSVTNPDNSVSTETGSISVTVTPNETNKGEPTIGEDVAYWKQLYDDKWAENDYADALRLAKTVNEKQEYYYMAYHIDGLVAIWRATGDNSYLDTVLSIINTTMDNASEVRNTYLGWPSAGEEYALWDSYYWRFVATLTRIMYQSPNLRASGYQAQYERLLEFSEKNIWDRYESKGSNNFYRSNTHMASHWARIAMELYIITEKQKYKEVFDNISFGTMDGRPSNLRNQLYANPNNPSAYAWSYNWGGNSVQDTSHGGAVVSFWVEAYENGMYWDKNDIDALITALDQEIWPNSAGSQFREDVDGGGDFDSPGRLNEWLNLGRFSQKIQNKIQNNYTGKNLDYYGGETFGIAALNAKILADGAPVYPENY